MFIGASLQAVTIVSFHNRIGLSCRHHLSAVSAYHITSGVVRLTNLRDRLHRCHELVVLLLLVLEVGRVIELRIEPLQGLPVVVKD
jgi:hypothetical protein